MAYVFDEQQNGLAEPSSNDTFFVKVGFTLDDKTYYISTVELQKALCDSRLNCLPYKDVIKALAK